MSTTNAFDDLTNYVVNLNHGQFAQDDLFSTTAQTVDSIFTVIAEEAQEAKEAGQLKHVVVWAHGGLDTESTGLQIAQCQLEWWLNNKVHPLFLVWHAGLLETVGELLEDGNNSIQDWVPDQAVQPRLLSEQMLDGQQNNDHTYDPIIEFLVHNLGGVDVWSQMKQDAALCSEAGGGALYVATKLQQLCKDYPNVRVHAVGHSAGAIVHAYFVTAFLSGANSKLDTLQFLAPAVRVDEFKNRLLPIINSGTQIREFAVYTMRDKYEQNDNCDDIYEKSLLYLVHFACEPARATPIFGLEKCIQADSDLRRLFNIPVPDPNGDFNTSGNSTIVWSVTNAKSGEDASLAIHHGDFDNDVSTMNSVLRRVLNMPTADLEYQYVPCIDVATRSSNWGSAGNEATSTKAPTTADVVSGIVNSSIVTE
jgi:hypothetical protein